MGVVNEMKKFSILITLILSCLYLQNFVYGISMAAFSEKNSMQIVRGETAEFFIFFWNPENEPSPVRLRATEVPDDLIIVITPSDFILNYSLVTEFPAEEGMQYINTQYGLMKTTPVKVTVKVPKTVEPGNYDFVVTATAGTPSGEVSAMLEKKFKFTVNVATSTFFETTTLLETTTELTTAQPAGENTIQRITGMITASPFTDLILLIVSVMTLAFVVWFIRFR